MPFERKYIAAELWWSAQSLVKAMGVEGAGSFVSTEEFDFVAQVGVVHLGQGGVAELKTGFQRRPQL
jgi:hypothetical protein